MLSLIFLCSLIFGYNSDMGEQFYRSGCLEFGRCETLLSAVDGHDTSTLRCLKAFELERIVQNPDSASRVIRPSVESASSRLSPVYWRGFVGLALGLSGGFGDSVIRVLFENADRLNFDSYHLQHPSVGLVSYIYAVRRNNHANRIVNGFAASPRLYWSNCLGRVEQNALCIEALRQLDSVKKWFPAADIREERLQNTVIGGPPLGVFLSTMQNAEEAKAAARQGVDTTFSRILKASRSRMNPKELSGLHKSCLKGAASSCKLIHDLVAKDSLACHDFLEQGLLYRMVLEVTSDQIDTMIRVLEPKVDSGLISIEKLLFAKKLIDVVRGLDSNPDLIIGNFGSAIVAEDRHWFPQVEMPPAFAIWFFGDSLKSKRQIVESRVPKLLALTAEEQMVCLRDTTKAHCGEIRDFVRETASWGGAESVKPFKFLIRPMTRKPPGWK